MSLESFFRRCRDEYFASVARGEHDDECERRERLHMCHCPKRKRIERGLTIAPSLIYENPTCDGCYESVYHDGDGWSCDNCNTSWGSNEFEEPGTFTDEYGDITAPDDERWGARLIGRDA